MVFAHILQGREPPPQRWGVLGASAQWMYLFLYLYLFAVHKLFARFAAKTNHWCDKNLRPKYYHT